MSTTPPPPMQGPRPRTVLLIVAGVVFALAVGTLIVGVFAAGYVLRHIHASDQNGASGERVRLESPWGSLRVRSGARAGSLAMPIFPNAKPIESDELNLDGRNARDADIMLDAGGQHLHAAASEFATTAAPSKVIEFYRQELGRRGPVEQSPDGRGGVKLTVKLANKNLWMVAVRPWHGGARFLLARVESGAGD
ncbi:MAG: hypothetical protein ACRD2H_03565 [Terriglobales bacterium]